MTGDASADGRTFPPEFVQRLQTVEADAGYTARLSCVVTGEPAPRVRWFRDEKELQEGAVYLFVCELPEGRHTLVIRNVHKRHEGVYRCRAESASGEASTVGYLSVKEKAKPKGNRFVSRRPLISTIKERKSQEETEEPRNSIVLDLESEDDVFESDAGSSGEHSGNDGPPRPTVETDSGMLPLPQPGGEEQQHMKTQVGAATTASPQATDERCPPAPLTVTEDALASRRSSNSGSTEHGLDSCKSLSDKGATCGLLVLAGVALVTYFDLLLGAPVGQHLLNVFVCSNLCCLIWHML